MLFFGRREVAIALGVLLASATLQGCADTEYATVEEAVEAVCGNMRCLDYCRDCITAGWPEYHKHSDTYTCGYPQKPENPCRVYDFGDVNSSAGSEEGANP